jgi:hypothetical protein
MPLFGHPFQDLPGWAISTLVVLALIALLGGIGMMRGPNRDMTARGGPGIVSFELAGTDAEARRILALWGRVGQAAALRSLTGDGLFIVGYAGLLTTLTGADTASIGHATWPWMGVATAVVAWLAIVAGLCDAVENELMAGILTRALRSEDWPPSRPSWVYRSAASKFTLLALVIGWLLLICVPILLISAIRATAAR